MNAINFSVIVNEGLMEKFDCKDPVFLDIYKSKLMNLILYGEINTNKLVHYSNFIFYC